MSTQSLIDVSAVSTGERTCWFQVSGELDLSTADYLEAVLVRLCEDGRCFARLDVSRVTFCDCASLGVLLAAHHRFLDAHGTLLLTGVGPPLSRLLEITGLDQVLFTTGRASAS